MTTNNAGLRALTTSQERKELRAVGRRKIKFAFFQSDFKGGRIPFWHVDYMSPSDFGTTLSMDGLKHWGII
jgi:hypothetical protein